MIATAMDVLHQFPVRKTKKQKENFRQAVCDYAQRLGYPVAVEAGKFGSQNVVMGEPETAEFLVTAHYDTPARMLLPNFCFPCSHGMHFLRKMAMRLGMLLLAVLSGILAGAALGGWVIIPISVLVFAALFGLMLFGPANPSNYNDNTSGVVTVLETMRTLPENRRHRACFVLFDLEEAGLVGSGAYRKAHQAATESQIVLNMDCVGEGDHLMMIPNKALLENRKKLTSLYKACGYFGNKSLLVREKGFSCYASDHQKFPLGVGICALKSSRFGLYQGRIHTPRDTCLDETNVNILRAALSTFICCTAVQEERNEEHETV